MLAGEVMGMGGHFSFLFIFSFSFFFLPCISVFVFLLCWPKRGWWMDGWMDAGANVERG